MLTLTALAIQYFGGSVTFLLLVALSPPSLCRTSHSSFSLYLIGTIGPVKQSGAEKLTPAARGGGGEVLFCLALHELDLIATFFYFSASVKRRIFFL